MVIINDDVVKGATLFGVALTLFGLGYIIEELIVNIVLFVGAGFYFIGAVIAFIPAVRKREVIRK